MGHPVIVMQHSTSRLMQHTPSLLRDAMTTALAIRLRDAQVFRKNCFNSSAIAQ
jgi:hypothetical protein